LELLLLNPAILLRKTLVDELDSKDWRFRAVRGGLFDAAFSRQPETILIWRLANSYDYHAYAPEPIVLDTIRNGTCVGSGASCE